MGAGSETYGMRVSPDSEMHGRQISLNLQMACHDGAWGSFIPLTLTCRAVLFDMDGTLVDSTHVVEAAWDWWAKRHKIPRETVLSFSHGRPTIATMEHFLPGQDHADELQEMTR